MRRAKGRAFSPDEVARIGRLLGNTEMTFQEIATRMSCAKSSIVAINQSLSIRDYQGRKSCWIVGVVESAIPAERNAI